VIDYDPAEGDDRPQPFDRRGLCLYERGPQPCYEPEFFLGVHRLNWTWEGAAGGPVFVNLHLIRPRVGLMEPATQDVGLDSGGFDEIARHGCWRWGVAEHVRLTRRAVVELRRVRFAAIQDWLCAPPALRRTGLSVAEHQARTLRSYLELRSAAPDIPWAPVLQGWHPDDYRRHRDDYAAAGVALHELERVMVGSIAGRDDDPGVRRLLLELDSSGIAVHALGAKGAGLLALGRHIHSGDSLAWSSRGKGIHANLCKHLGVDRKTLPADVLRLLEGRELPPARATEAELVRRFGPDPRRPGQVQSLANSQSFAEYWRSEQLAQLAEAADRYEDSVAALVERMTMALPRDRAVDTLAP